MKNTCRVLLLLAASMPAFAQCSMCYQNASASGAKGIRALNLGIIILLVPPLAIGACIGRLAYRYRDSSSETR